MKKVKSHIWICEAGIKICLTVLSDCAVEYRMGRRASQGYGKGEAACLNR